MLLQRSSSCCRSGASSRRSSWGWHSPSLSELPPPAGTAPGPPGPPKPGGVPRLGGVPAAWSREGGWEAGLGPAVPWSPAPPRASAGRGASPAPAPSPCSGCPRSSYSAAPRPRQTGRSSPCRPGRLCLPSGDGDGDRTGTSGTGGSQPSPILARGLLLIKRRAPSRSHHFDFQHQLLLVRLLLLQPLQGLEQSLGKQRAPGAQRAAGTSLSPAPGIPKPPTSMSFCFC